MTESRSHKMAANRIAKKYKTDYNAGPGPDIKSPKAVVEIETEETIQDAGRQLSGYRGPVYVAGTNQAAVDAAVEKYKDTTIGVMNNQGKIVKRSTRKK